MGESPGKEGVVVKHYRRIAVGRIAGYEHIRVLKAHPDEQDGEPAEPQESGAT